MGDLVCHWESVLVAVQVQLVATKTKKRESSYVVVMGRHYGAQPVKEWKNGYWHGAVDWCVMLVEPVLCQIDRI